MESCTSETAQDNQAKLSFKGSIDKFNIPVPAAQEQCTRFRHAWKLQNHCKVIRGILLHRGWLFSMFVYGGLV